MREDPGATGEDPGATGDELGWDAVLPARVSEAILGSDHARSYFADVRRLLAMDDADLVHCAQVCLSNVERTLDEDEDAAPADFELRALLAPELCERIVPGGRMRLRRITTSCAEWICDPLRPSFFSRFRGFRGRGDPWGTAVRSAALREEHDRRVDAACLRARIAMLSAVSIDDLLDRTRAAIGASRVMERWQPYAFVYDPGLTYRVIPVLARRAWARRSAPIRALARGEVERAALAWDAEHRIDWGGSS